jgi:hypothetical protein
VTAALLLQRFVIDAQLSNSQALQTYVCGSTSALVVGNMWGRSGLHLQKVVFFLDRVLTRGRRAAGAPWQHGRVRMPLLAQRTRSEQGGPGDSSSELAHDA